MLTAVTILALVSMLLVGVSNQISQIWTRSENSTQNRLRARAVLDYMAREIRRAALPLDQSRQSLQFIINPTTVSEAYRYRDALFWQAPIGINSQAGGMAEVGYFVQWDGNQPNLYRFFVNPGDVDNYLIYSDPSGWISDTVLARVVPVGGLTYQGLFLENVMGLWIKAYEANGTTEYSGDSRSYTPNRLPAFVQISLVLLDKTGARRLKDLGASSVNALYAKDTAEAFAAALPVALKPSATVISLKISLDDHK